MTPKDDGITEAPKTFPLPQYIEDRRKHCRACPEATRLQVGDTWGVTLMSICPRAQQVVMYQITNPDATCPRLLFGRALMAPGLERGTFQVEDGKIVGWNPLGQRLKPGYTEDGKCGKC